MSRYIHNVSGETKYYLGVPVTNEEFFLIPESSWFGYASSDSLISDITSGDVFISKDGSNDITSGVSSQIDYLKGINSLHTVQFQYTDTAGLSKVAIEKSTGDFTTHITHNFCDNTTWTATNDSAWTMTPDEDTILSVVKAEVQFEHDINIAGTNGDEIYLDYYGWHPSSPGTPILFQRIVFDSVRSIFELGNQHYHSPGLPEISGGLTTVVFDYANKLTFYANQEYGALAYLQITTKSHVQITGTYATVGLVTNSESV